MPFKYEDFGQFLELINEEHFIDKLTSEPRILEYHQELRASKTNKEQHLSKGFKEPFTKSSTARSAKQRYKNRLIDTILSQPISVRSKKHFGDNVKQLYKEFSALKMAQVDSKVNAAITLANEILPRALKYSVTPIIVDVAAYLLRSHLFFSISDNKIDYYKQVYEDHVTIQRMEEKVEIAYSELGYLLRKKKLSNEKLGEFCLNFVAEHENHNLRDKSYVFQKMFFNLNCIGYYFINDLNKMKSTAQLAVDYFSNYSIVSAPTITLFQRHVIRVQLIEGDFEEAEANLNNILETTSTKSPNWFNTRFLLFKKYLLQGEYEKAISQFIIVSKNSKFKSLPPIFKNPWDISEAYVSYLQLIGKGDHHSKISRFKINKFINSRSDLITSKKKYNIQLLIAQLMFYFYDKNYKNIDDRIDSISRYTSRYLKKDETYRSQIFIKMLVEIPRQNYSRIAIERHTSRFKKKLKDNPLQLDISKDNIEIIPYERLWEMIMENLKR